jgi:predicted TIM-barrel fold metal-dependent hydrolase
MGIAVIVDTHTHVVSSDEGRYPLQCSATEVDDPSSWPLHARVSAEELAAEMRSCGVERACLVQGWAAYQFDNRYTLAAAEADAAHFVSVCALDTQDPEAPARLEAMTTQPRLRGIRLVSGFMKAGDSLDSAGAKALWSAANRLGLVVVAFTLGDDLAPFVSAARVHSEHPVVLDHCAFIDVVKDFDRLASLARLENVYLKVSTRVLTQGEPARILRQLADHFGAGRLMWGSDYPASHERSYREWVELARAATGSLTKAEADRFLAGTALELWPELR